jgi:peptide/nickel transport system permease protein
MLTYVLRRVLQMFLVLFGVSTLIFVLLRMSGDPVTLFVTDVADTAALEQVREQMGFNDPLPVQYARFLGDVVRGDFGDSFRSRRPAMGLALQRVPATLELTLAGILFGTLLAVPAGIVAAVRRGTRVDLGITGLLSLGQSVPIFVVGFLLILLVAVPVQQIPTSGRGELRHLLLPALTLGLFFMARIARITRTSVLEVLELDFANTARAKGASEFRVVTVHVLRNAAASIVTVIAYLLATVISGAIVTEAVFAWPGLGSLMVDGVRARDFPVVQASVFVVALMVVVANLVADVLIAVIDPRIRLE